MKKNLEYLICLLGVMTRNLSRATSHGNSLKDLIKEFASHDYSKTKFIWDILITYFMREGGREKALPV